jgi:hypothetical protein
VESELSFLINLVLDTKLNPYARKILAERVRVLESCKTAPLPTLTQPTPTFSDRMQPAAAQALADRQKAIQASLGDKPEPGRTSPRKF